MLSPAIIKFAHVYELDSWELMIEGSTNSVNEYFMLSSRHIETNLASVKAQIIKYPILTFNVPPNVHQKC